MEAAPLPDLATALADLGHLMHARDGGTLGVIAFAVLPSPELYRLPPESMHRLRTAIVERLREHLRRNDRLYVLGPREWLLVLPALPGAGALPLAMRKLDRAFREAAPSIDGLRLHLRTACGGALFPDDGSDALHLVQSARIARLQADREGLPGCRYEPRLEETDAATQALDAELRRAFTSDPGLQLHLQPQVDARDGRCIGVEALLRWQRASREWVPPATILAAIERTGLRPHFNRWLFLKAAQASRRLTDAGFPLRLSINLAAADLLEPETPDLLFQALATWDVSPASIQIEITETGMVQEAQGALAVLREMDRRGLHLSIDDFGTGFSSMSYLRTLPVREIKIDQGFVRDLPQAGTEREITESIVRLGQRLGLEVVAEGVERAEIAAALLAMGCHRQQGLHYSPARPLDDLLDWLTTTGRSSTAIR
jgi:EAL domain-containing protein (putative c-di-GMP-specific phosphodiesterase class I)